MSGRPRPEARSQPSNGLDDEFARAMADVVPLRRDPRGRAERPVRAAPLPPADERPVESGPPPDDYVAPGVDVREIRKLRRGDHAVRGRLDLHGMMVSEASRSVAQFIERSRHARHRCVCIIHGKGLNSAGGVSTLRRVTREVLMRTSSVLAFASAPPSGGGAGAVYVLLRR
jgi:DNA-nicking Smr family endonuclease